MTVVPSEEQLFISQVSLMFPYRNKLKTDCSLYIFMINYKTNTPNYHYMLYTTVEISIELQLTWYFVHCAEKLMNYYTEQQQHPHLKKSRTILSKRSRIFGI